MASGGIPCHLSKPYNSVSTLSASCYLFCLFTWLGGFHRQYCIESNIKKVIGTELCCLQECPVLALWVGGWDIMFNVPGYLGRMPSFSCRKGKKMTKSKMLQECFSPQSTQNLSIKVKSVMRLTAKAFD